MKQLLAVIYLVIFFLSAVLHEKKNMPVNDYQQSKVSVVLENSNQCGSSENHENSEDHCLNCHFGHCSIIVNAFAQAFHFHDEVVHPRINSLVYLYNYQFGLFRPPIS